jgi:hypothetical protein
MDTDKGPSKSPIFISITVENQQLTSLLSYSKCDIQQRASARTDYLYFTSLDFTALQCTVAHFEEPLFLHLIMKSILH